MTKFILTLIAIIASVKMARRHATKFQVLETIFLKKHK